jgi:MFS transporter, PPP family, 3-phenylpropionic acid transporter
MGDLSPGAHLMSSALARWVTPELRASVFHFTVFLSTGVSSVYLAIWLSEKGIPPDEIGIINAVPVLILLGLNLFIGRLADKASDWRTVIIIMAVLAGALPIGLFFVNEFWGILLVWSFCAMSAGSIPPVIDAATVRLTQRNGSDFGAVRAWGTVGYTVATAATGVVIAMAGPSAFVPLFFVLALLRTLAALQLPRFRVPPQQATLAAVKPGAAKLREVLRPWFVLPLVAFALVNATHSILSGFAALVWHSNGVPDAAIGPLIAISAAAEALLMFVWKRFGGRISARHMILLAAAVTVFRWTVMAFNPPVYVLFALQTLHAITYGVGYFGMVHFIANWTSEEIAAEAQSFAYVLQQAMSVVALLGFGWLVAQFGIASFFSASIFGALAIVCVLVSLSLRPAKDAH